MTDWTRRDLLRRAGAGAGLALAPGLIAACGGGGGSDEPPPPRSKKIGLSLAGDYPFAVCVASGAFKALEGSGYQLLVTQAGFSADREIANLAKLIDAKIAGLVIQPVAIEGATRGAQFAQQAGVRVSTTMSPGLGPGSKFFAGVVEVPGRQGGRMIGRWLIDNVPGGGEIIVVQGILGQGVSEPLDEGLEEALKVDPRYRVVLRGPGNLDPSQAVNLVERGLALHPRAKMIVDYGAVMGDAISAYLERKRASDVVHVTSDADDSTPKWLRTPYLRATRYFSAAQTGREATRIVLEAAKQDKTAVTPFTHVVPQSMRTAANIGAAVPFCDAAFEARAKAALAAAR
jgi:ABC-type sugar transport system substrate-binding protein